MVYVYYKITESGLSHREQHIVASEMLDFLLKNIEGKDYCLKVDKTPKGKPFLTNSEAKFSLSHANGCVVCAVASKKPLNISKNVGEYIRVTEIPVDADDVGCDVEPFNNKLNFRSDIRISKRFFTESEKQQMISDTDPEREFIRIWTAKESFVKCTGEGIGGIKKADITDLPDNFYIYKFEISPEEREYSVSVCIQKNKRQHD